MDSLNHLIPLLTLIVLETILGIENITFISILAGKLPLAQQKMSLVTEGLHVEIPKGYTYFAMTFAFLVDLIQMKTVAKTSNPRVD